MPDELDRLFLRVVETGSLKAAARERGLNPSVVSRRIVTLEDRLGVKLLTRSTRRSTPTEAGARYYDGIRRLSEQQAALQAEVGGQQDTPRGTLTIASAAEFGTRFVAPVAMEMQGEFPDLSVALTLGSGFSDLVAEGIDVAIRIGRLPDSSLVARRIGSIARVIVAAPDYLDRAGRPRVPPDLARLSFINYIPGRHETQLTLEYEGTTVTQTVSGRFSVNSVNAIRRALLAGMGAHIGPVWAFAEDILHGRLEVVLPAASTAAFPVHAVYQRHSFQPAKLRVFVARMQAALKAEEQAFTAQFGRQAAP